MTFSARLFLFLIFWLGLVPIQGVAQIVARYDAGLAGSPTPLPPNQYQFNGQVWTNFSGGVADGTNSPVAPDATTGFNAWNMTDTSPTNGGVNRYTFALSSNTLNQAAQNGWTFKMRARLVTDFGGNATCHIQYGDPGRPRFVIIFDLDANTNLIAQLLGAGGGTYPLTSNGSGNAAYHVHEIIFDPVGKHAAFYFDGTLIRSGWMGEVNAQEAGGPGFGTGSGSGVGSMNFNLVEQAFYSAPLAVTLPPSAPATNSATLNGVVIPRNTNAFGWFEWGATTNYGNFTPPRPLGGGFVETNFSQTVSGLTVGSGYHYRTVASNSLGVARGADQTFKAVLWVTSLADSGPGSLRQILQTAPPGTTINFVTNGDIDLAGGLVITNNLTIEGPPDRTTIRRKDSSAPFRIFDITAGTVSFSRLNVMNGSVTNSGGGGIRNAGALTLDRCAIFSNRAAQEGGGILNLSNLFLNQCTVSSNIAGTGGGGLWSQSGLAIIRQSTISSNTAATAGGGLVMGAGSIANSIIAVNAGGNVAGVSYTNLGNNFLSANPLLGPLQDNGGTTLTHALLSGSPARNAGNDALAPAATDQRGFPRFGGGTTDIGAYEFNPSYTAPFGQSNSWNVYLLVDSPATWVAAHGFAQSLRFNGVPGHLASIHSAQENAFIRSIARATDTWIGLTDNASYGGAEAGTNRNTGWVWTSGESFTYENFDVGQPDNFTGEGLGEDAVHLLSNGSWNDRGIGAFGESAPQYRYVIEFETRAAAPVENVLPAPPILPPAPLLSGCAGGPGYFYLIEARGNSNVADVSGAAARLVARSGTLYEGIATTVNHWDPDDHGSGGLFGGKVPFLSDLPDVSDSDIQALFRGRIRIGPANEGFWTFRVQSDDGFALRLVAQPWLESKGGGFIDPSDAAVLTFPGLTANSATMGVIYLASADYDVELVTFERFGVSFWELSAGPGYYPSNQTLIGALGGLPLVGRPLALAFDGTNDFVNLDTNGVVLGGTFTQEAWIRPQLLDNDAHGFLGYASSTLLQDAAPSLWVVGQTALRGGFGTGSQFQSWTTPSGVLELDDWNHVAATYDGSAYRAYVNGALLLTTNLTGPVASTPLQWIGRVDSFFRGQIDEVRLWNVARSQFEIQADMNRLLSGTESNLVAYWRFDECGTMQVADQTGHGHTGVLVGGLAATGWVESSVPAGETLLPPRPIINAVTRLFDGQVRIQFTGITGITYFVLASTDVALPMAQWSSLGPATALGANLFEFIDSGSTNQARRFYRLQVP